MKLSERVMNIQESPTLAMASKAKVLRAAGVDIISFGAGEPDFDTPVSIKDAAVKAINAGFTKYTAVGGTGELKDAIIDKFRIDNGLVYTRDEILVSCGAKHSFFNVCQALFDKGDEVIIPSPYWVSYPAIVQLAGANPVIVPTLQSNNFRMSAEDFEKAITPSTRAVIINSPSNPAGIVYSVSELHEIGEVALNNDIIIISDEIYEKIYYEESEFVSVASLSEGMKSRTIVLNGVSKSYAMTGWRIGYSAAPKEVVRAMTVIQSQSTSNPSSISQKAAVEALSGDQGVVVAMVREFDARRRLIVSELNSIDGIDCVMPEGAFYVFPDVSHYFGTSFGGRSIDNSVDFSDYLLDEVHVAVVPGSAFGSDSHVRLSYAASLDDIKEGLKRIKWALNNLM